MLCNQESDHKPRQK